MRSKKKIEKNKNTKKFTPPKTHHDIHSSPTTATTPRRRATKHVPRISTYSPTSIDPGFVEIVFVQLSRLPMAKTASVASLPRPVFLQQLRKKRRITHHRRHKSSQRPPPGIPLLQSCEVALERVSDPLGARGNGLYGLGTDLVGESLDDIQKMQTSPCPCRLSSCWREPRENHKAHGGHSTSYY